MLDGFGIVGAVSARIERRDLRERRDGERTHDGMRRVKT